jgi:hypothetical protein
MPGADQPGTGDPGADQPGAEGSGSQRSGRDEPGRDERERARRLAEVFGDVLPEATADDLDDEPGGHPERWYTENRPPHHDAR